MNPTVRTAHGCDSGACAHSTPLKVKSGHHHAHSSKADLLMNILEKVSAVALGVFAALTDLKLFLPALAIGVAIGIYCYFEDKKHGNHMHSISSCSQGFLEQITGVKMPAPILLGANIAITVCHIDHHATVFVPIVGLSIGAWIGKMSTECGALLYRKFAHHHCQHDHSTMQLQTA